MATEEDGIGKMFTPPEERYRSIFEYSSDGILLLDPEAKVIIANPAAEKMLGFASNELIGKPMRETYKPEQQAAFERRFADLHKEKRLQFERELIPRDGATINTEMVIELLPDGNILQIIHDVTAKKILERSKGQFLAIASHEMRTPLAIIRSNAELLLDEKPVVENEETKQEVQRILKGSVRLLGIVNDFLDVENLEANKVSLKLTPTDLVPLIRDIVADLSGAATEKHITLAFQEPATPLPPMTLDRYRVQQILINLISNGIHYTVHGGVTLSMESGKSAVVISVTDTGIGMDAEDQKRLFQKFQTGKAFLESREYGSGLGLYVSRLLAGLMGMTIKLEKSELGKGSTFSLSIPFPAA
jgi:two-component system phosphate regulon sensor histidine kinase PhoR